MEIRQHVTVIADGQRGVIDDSAIQMDGVPLYRVHSPADNEQGFIEGWYQAQYLA
jgi:hypothetical protein